MVITPLLLTLVEPPPSIFNSPSAFAESCGAEIERVVAALSVSAVADSMVMPDCSMVILFEFESVSFMLFSLSFITKMCPPGVCMVILFSPSSIRIFISDRDT